MWRIKREKNIFTPTIPLTEFSQNLLLTYINILIIKLNMRKLLIFIFILLIFSFFNTKESYALVYFKDDFEGTYSGGWFLINNTCTYNGKPATWELQNGKFGMKINGGGCNSNIKPTVLNIPTNIGYVLSVDVDFTNIFQDRNFIFKFQDLSNWYGIHTYGDGITVEKVVNGTGLPMINQQFNYCFKENSTHHFKIEINNFEFKIWINGSLKATVIDSDPTFLNSSIALRASAGGTPDSEVWFDNVMVCSLDDPCGDVVPTSTPTPTNTPSPTNTPTPTATPTPTNTPTPTPTPTPKIPVIIIPGHGACFSREGILEGQENVPQEKWKILPFVHEYDGLINSIKNSGYVMNKDLFVFCYDWRKRIEQTADVLKDFILNKVLAGRTDTNQTKIVGHSMGGLIGRSFAQKYKGVNLEELITIGSPHKGVIQAYYPWEGGEPPGEKNFQWLAWQFLIQAQRRNFATNVETVRKVAPSTQDLLPTFNFLKYPNGNEKNLSSLIWKNNWLYDLNNSLPDPPFLDKTTAVVGEKGDTPAWYKIIDRSWLDKLLCKWEDGKPIETEFETGDLTVLRKSAQIPEDLYESLNLDHGELVRTSKGIRKTMELLNIPEVLIEEGTKFELTPSLIFALGSPVNIVVTTPSGNSFSGGEEKFVFIPNPPLGIYNIQIIPEGAGGNFRLLIGQETEGGNFWNEINETINTVPFNFQINFDPQKPTEFPILDSSGKSYLDFAAEKILLLKNDYRHQILDQILKEINNAKNLINEKKYLRGVLKVEKIIDLIFKFRKDNSIPKARNISFEAVELLKKAYEILINNSEVSVDPNRLKAKIKSTQNLINSTEKTLQKLNNKGKLTPANGVSFDLAKKEFEKAQKSYQNKNYSLSKIQLAITQALLKESLIIK